MMFWERLADHGSPALVDAATGDVVTYAALADESDRLADWMLNQAPAGRAKLCFLFVDNSRQAVTAYLAALKSADSRCAPEPTLHEELAGELVRRYRPELVLAAGPGCRPETKLDGYVSLTSRRPWLGPCRARRPMAGRCLTTWPCC